MNPLKSPLIASLLLAASPLLAGTVELSQNNINGVYAVGETMTFTVNILEGVENLDFTIYNGVTPDPVEPDSIEIHCNDATIQYTAEQPSCVIFTVKHTDGTKYSLGAVAAPFEIQPSMPTPSDFAAYWQTKKAALAAIPLNPRITPVDNAPNQDWGPDVESFDIQLDSYGDRPVSGYFVRPVGAGAGTLPIVLSLHSAGVRDSSLPGASNRAKQNKLSMDINAHGIANAQLPQFYTDLNNGELNNYGMSGLDADPDNYYLLGMYLRIVRAIDFLTAQPEWDGQNILLAGESQGGGQSLIGAGLDSRVTEIEIVVPAFCDLTSSIIGRQPGWPVWKHNVSEAQQQTLRYFDAANFAPDIQATVRTVVGLIDGTCPASGIFATYNKIPSEKTIIILPMRNHGGNAESSAAEKDPQYSH